MSKHMILEEFIRRPDDVEEVMIATGYDGNVWFVSNGGPGAKRYQVDPFIPGPILVPTL